MTFIYIQGKVNLQSYEKACTDNGFCLNDKKVVFLFPGNASHHGKSTTLFSIKGGAGLAAASQLIGEKGYPTLSLPTTSMEQFSSSKTQRATVYGAINDLYRAFGAGYSFMLPVRSHDNTIYFDLGFIDDETGTQIEPNFWGGVQMKPNKPLAQYYIDQLTTLSLFMKLPPDERDLLCANGRSEFYSAYLLGQNTDVESSSSDHKIQHLSAQQSLLQNSLQVYEKANIDKFQRLLEEIQIKSIQFTKDGETQAANAASAFYVALNSASIDYFKSQKTKQDYSVFKKKCDVAIEPAKEVLKHHRGWPHFFAKCILIIIGIGVLAAAISKDGFQFRLFKTDSTKKLEDISTCITKMSL